MNLSAVAWSIAGVLIVAVLVRRRRVRRREEIAWQQRQRRDDDGEPGEPGRCPPPLPRRRPVTYIAAGPLRPHEEDQFAALVFCYRYVHIPEPSERRGQ